VLSVTAAEIPRGSPVGPSDLALKLRLTETSDRAMVFVGAAVLAGAVVPFLMLGDGHGQLMVALCLLAVAVWGVVFILVRRRCCTLVLPVPYRTLYWQNPSEPRRTLDVDLIERMTTPVDQDDEFARYQLAFELKDGRRVLLCSHEWHMQSYPEELAQRVRAFLEQGRVHRSTLDSTGSTPPS
jgi:hypothetical protein